MLNKYYEFINDLNNLYLDSINNFTNKKTKNLNNIKPFELNFNLNINEKFLNSKLFKITDKLYKEIIYVLFEIKFKINWLKNEYDNEILKTTKKIEEINLIKNELNEYKNELLDNILDSNTLKYSNQKIINYDFDYLENFNIDNNYIYPIFYNIKEIDFQQEIHSSKKIVLNIEKMNFVSKINLSFNTNIKEEIIIMYKKNYSSKIEFTSEKIKLSKNKSISLKFVDCSQIIIFSNSNFVEYINNIKIFGSNDKLENSQIKGIINLKNKIKNIMIETNEDYYFYVYDENKELDQMKLINNNLINEVNTDKILMICDTDKTVLNKFNIYKKD